MLVGKSGNIIVLSYTPELSFEVELDDPIEDGIKDDTEAMGKSSTHGAGVDPTKDNTIALKEVLDHDDLMAKVSAVTHAAAPYVEDDNYDLSTVAGSYQWGSLDEYVNELLNYILPKYHDSIREFAERVETGLDESIMLTEALTAEDMQEIITDYNI